MALRSITHPLNAAIGSECHRLQCAITLVGVHTEWIKNPADGEIIWPGREVARERS